MTTTYGKKKVGVYWYTAFQANEHFDLLYRQLRGSAFARAGPEKQGVVESTTPVTGYTCPPGENHGQRALNLYVGIFTLRQNRTP